MSVDLQNLYEIVNRKYKNIGKVIDITPLNFSFTVNNELFFIKTNKINYILKYNEALNDFYGISNSLEKLEHISLVSKIVKDYGLAIEEVIESTDGNYASEFMKGSIRIFKFIKGREYSIHNHDDCIKMIHFSKDIHNFPLEILNKKTDNYKDYLKAPYPLEESVAHSDYIKFNLKKEALEVEDWNQIFLEFDLLLSQAQNFISWNKSRINSLVHADFHPRNVIIDESEVLHTIDLDYLRIGNPYVCLGLTFTRTAFFGKKVKDKIDLENLFYLFFENYEPNSNISEFKKNLLLGASYIEVEKIFRNLLRFYRTGKYKKFSDDVLTMHYPIHKILNQIIEHDGIMIC